MPVILTQSINKNFKLISIVSVRLLIKLRVLRDNKNWQRDRKKSLSDLLTSKKRLGYWMRPRKRKNKMKKLLKEER